VKTVHEHHASGKYPLYIPLYNPIIVIPLLVGGFNPSEKYEFASWDDDIPNIWKKKSHVPNHEPVK